MGDVSERPGVAQLADNSAPRKLLFSVRAALL